MRKAETKVRAHVDRRVQMFILHYLATQNATESAIKAGYSPVSAHVRGHRLLKNPHVVKVLAARQALDAAQAGVDPAEVLAELKALAFSRIDDYEVDEINGTIKVREGKSPRTLAAVQSVKFRTKTDENGNVFRETEIKLWDKVTPLITAGKHVGLFTDQALEKLARKIIEEATKRELSRLGPTERKFIEGEVVSETPTERE